ncbi:MAG: 4Fe-4S dicluster domain-containing protein, partial [Thermodesulfobacteriota bacterium]
MVIDLNRCTACQACTVACQAENNIPFAGPRESGLGRAIFWNELIVTIEGDFPNGRVTYIPRPCMHCDNAPCTKVCPVNATYRNPEGIVAQIPGRCIGCRFCMSACPYTARSFNWHKPTWPKPMEKQHNPDVAVRPKGVVEKCLFCIHRLKKAKLKAQKDGRKLTDDDVMRLPACCQTCPAGARV